MAATISVEEAQPTPRELIHQLAPGEEVVITENHQPIAKLVGEPLPKPRLRLPPGLIVKAKGSVVIGRAEILRAAEEQGND